MIIKTRNTQHETAPKTYLTATMASGTDVLTVKNVAGFSDNWNAIIGEPGVENTEIVEIVSVPSAGTFGVGATSFEHGPDTPVYCVKYNQVVFKRSTDGTAGTATSMANGTIGITPDWGYTQFDDTSGSASYAYKTCYRSTGLATNSSDSGWITPSGYSFFSLANIRERAKDKFSGDYEDSKWNDWINEWMEKMTNAAIDVNEDYCMGTVQISYSGTAQYGTIPGTCNFKQVRRAWYTENGSDWYQMSKQEYVDFGPSQEFSATHPYYHMKGDDELGRNPHSASGTIDLTHYKLNTVLSDETDELPVPMRGYTGSFVDYALAQALKKDEQWEEAKALEGKCEYSLSMFVKEMTPRNKSEQTGIQIVESLEDDGDFYIY